VCVAARVANLAVFLNPVQLEKIDLAASLKSSGLSVRAGGFLAVS